METESETLSPIIETMPDTTPGTEGETEAETEPTVSAVQFPPAALLDYARYNTAGRIKEILSGRATYAFTVGGAKHTGTAS